MARRKKETSRLARLSPEPPPEVILTGLLKTEETEKLRFAQAYLEASLDAVLQCVHAVVSAEVAFSSYAKRTKDSSVQAERLGLNAILDESFLGAYSFALNHMQILTIQVTEARRRLLGQSMVLDTVFEKAKKIFEPKKLFKIVDEWSSDPVVEPHWERMVKLYNATGVKMRLMETKP